MCELLELRGNERVLDVGTGSGYHAAVLARLAAEVHGVEIREPLVAAARSALAEAGAANVVVHLGDGRAGLPEAAPFDAINVAAAGPPDRLRTLCSQLAPGGRLVAPVEEEGRQRLVVLRCVDEGRIVRENHEQVRFVPLDRLPIATWRVWGRNPTFAGGYKNRLRSCRSSLDCDSLAVRPEMSLSHLTCPTCHFSVAAAAATSPFQNCPRCLLRDQRR